MAIPQDTSMEEPPDNVDPNELPPSEAPQENMSVPDQPQETIVARTDIGASSMTPSFTVAAPEIKAPEFQKKENNDSAEPEKKKTSVGARVTLFGSTEKTYGGGLEGYLFDLKQTAAKKPTPMAGVPDEKCEPGSAINKLYAPVLQKFVKNGMRDVSLSEYFKVNQPMYLSHLMIPQMSANEAPKAFNVEKEVQPRRWAIHYKGKISPPETGKYRFWGFCDDVLVVSIDGNIVLNSGCVQPNIVPDEPSTLSSPKGKDGKGVYPPIGSGKWRSMLKGQNYNMDILIGEWPGGSFCAFLFVEKEGVNYEKDENGFMILPLFKANNAPLKLDKEQIKRLPYKFKPEGLVFQAQ